MMKSIKLMTLLVSVLSINHSHAQRKLPEGIAYFIYDNGPDYVKNRTQRIEKDGKIGYINARKGKIIIAPQYKCAEPFKNGKAMVSYNCSVSEKDSEGHSSWGGGDWFYIDKRGRKLKTVKN